MVEQDTLSVKEFAQVVGTSKQAVYQRLKTSLIDKYVTLTGDDGKEEKRIFVDVLTDEQKEKLEILRQSEKSNLESSTLKEQGGVGVKGSRKQSLNEKAEVEQNKGNQGKESQTRDGEQTSEGQIAFLIDQINFLRGEINTLHTELINLTAVNMLQAQQIATLQLQAPQRAEKSQEEPQEAPQETEAQEPIENKGTEQKPQEAVKRGFWWKVREILKTDL